MEEYGSVKYKGKTLNITCFPYAETRSWVGEDTKYYANARDAQGKEYEISWEITDPLADEVDQTCDWDKYEVLER